MIHDTPTSNDTMHAPGYRGQFKTGRVDGGQFWMNGVAKVEKSTASTAEGLGHKA